MKLLVLALSLVAGLCLSGCVTGRRSVELPITSLRNTALNNSAVTLVSVTDARTFENKPSEPSTPSIDGDVTKLSAEEKAKFIGRQRGGFGKAMGDIVLEGGETVPSKMKQLIGEGLARRGHPQAPDGPVKMDVEIVQFWAWFTPGMFYVTFEAQLEAKVTATSDGKTQVFRVKGYGENKGQVAKDENWQEAYTRAFDDFLKNFATSLNDVGM